MLNKFYHIYIENKSLDFLLVLTIGFVAYYIARFIVTSIVVRIFRKTATKIDDILIEKGVLNKLSYLVPVVVIYNQGNYVYVKLEILKNIYML